ncbi:hypothetical protein AX15_005902 [Amanita polypyramis BW_CC]|nr:hypothetical protein AX15_005902 [Amanita polypyramis BW_CC]
MRISTAALVGSAVLFASFPGVTSDVNVIYHCTVPNTVALTLDDGPWIYAKDAADALSNANAKGTFFYIDCIYNPDEVKRVQYVYGKGHQIASHTWSHPNLTTLSHDQSAPHTS